jgi:hypothetical protein
MRAIRCPKLFGCLQKTFEADKQAEEKRKKG